MNRGFGGSEVFDALNYADRLVLKYHAAHIVMYSGSNDINAGKSPQRVLTDIKAFVAKVHAALPDCRISYISNAPNPKRWSMIEQNARAEPPRRGVLRRPTSVSNTSTPTTRCSALKANRCLTSLSPISFT
jgi:hypothetical protein